MPDVVPVLCLSMKPMPEGTTREELSEKSWPMEAIVHWFQSAEWTRLACKTRLLPLAVSAVAAAAWVSVPWDHAPAVARRGAGWMTPARFTWNLFPQTVSSPAGNAGMRDCGKRCFISAIPERHTLSGRRP